MVLPLRTERLTLSVLTAADRAAFVRYRRDPDVARWQSWSTTYSDDDADEAPAKESTKNSASKKSAAKKTPAKKTAKKTTKKTAAKKKAS